MSSSKKRKSDDHSLAVDDALTYIVQGDNVRPPRGNLNLTLAVSTLETQAACHGLHEDDIANVVTAIVTHKYAQSTLKKLVHCLVPCHSVPVSCVLQVLSAICARKLSVALQAELIRWILCVYDDIDDKDRLHAVYNIFFYLLNYEIMCPTVCHLLYLMTRKEDACLYRVRALLQLQRKMGQQRHILGLLYVYKLYAPHLVSVDIPKAIRVFYKRLRTSKPASRSNEISSQRHLLGTKRLNDTVIPAVDGTISQTAFVTPSRRQHPLVPFVHIKSFQQLLDNLDMLQLPGQMAAVLENRLLQSLLRCHPDVTLRTRLVHWLDSTLRHELLNATSGETERGTHLLKTLVYLAQFLKEGIPICDVFLARFLHQWNGSDYRVLILKLITRIRLRPFGALNDVFLEPLRREFFSSSVYFKCQIVICFTELLRNMVAVEWPRLQYTRQRQHDLSDNQSDKFSVFESDWTDAEAFRPLQTVASLVGFVDNISSVGILQENGHMMLLHCVLAFFELVASLHIDYGIAIVIMPSSQLVRRCTLCWDAATLNRLCALMCSYRRAFESLHSNSATSMASEMQEMRDASMTRIASINMHVVSLCDTLWRCRSTGRMDEAIRRRAGLVNLPRRLAAVHRHSALMVYVCKFLESLPEGTSVDSALVRDSIDDYLQLLADHQLDGICQFIRAFVNRKLTSTTQSTTGKSPFAADAKWTLSTGKKTSRVDSRLS